MPSLNDLKSFYEPKVFIQEPLNLVELKVVETPEKRFYVTPEGKHYPSATTFLSSMDDEGDPDWFAKWGAKLGGLEFAEAESQRCCDRGTAVHLALENLLLNKPNPDRFAGIYRKMYIQLQTAMIEHVDIVHALEACLYSDALELAGRVDCIATWDKVLSIVDFKTSTQKKKKEWITDYFIQTTLYSLMLEERTGLKAEQLVVAIAIEGDPRPQIFVVQRKDYIPILADMYMRYKAKQAA